MRRFFTGCLFVFACTLLYPQYKTVTEREAGEAAGKFYASVGGGSGSGGSINALQKLMFTGKRADDLFGAAVAIAGDVNGDGFSDIIVGARNNDANGSNAGAAYIFYGGAAVNAVADVTLLGSSAGDGFGASVAGAGDLNGDGYADVVVGAPSSDITFTDAGYARVYYGGAAMDNVPDVTIAGAGTNYFVGGAVAGAGDVNADGYADLIIGATGVNSAEGSAMLYFGGSPMNSIADLTFSAGLGAGSYFGTSVAGPGDINGDGYADVAVASFSYTDTTRVLVYFGGASMNSAQDLSLTGSGVGDYFGYSLAGGDFNGDGFADLLVGAMGDDDGYTNQGRAYIFNGGAAADALPDLVINGHAAGLALGRSVASAGDVNGDGVADVVVGLNYANNQGRAYVYFGGAAMDTTIDRVVNGEASQDNFGYAVGGGGDVNGDGYDDVIAGAPYNDAAGADAGRAYLILNTMNGYDSPAQVFTGAGAYNYFGNSIAPAGDVNGDGYKDIIVGAYYYNSEGRAYIFFGGPAMDAVADVTLTADAVEDQYGFAVSSAGDFNGDGYDDVAVGAPNNDAGGTNAGKLYIYYGGESMNASVDLILYGAAGDQLGKSVAAIGDVNNDGYQDLAVGAPEYDQDGIDNRGAVYVLYGGYSPNTTPDKTFIGLAANHLLGRTVAAAGDVNGDGFADFLAGEPGNTVNGYNSGAVYLYLGGTHPTYGLVFRGNTSGEWLGSYTMGAGDFNGDGFSDVILGSPGNDGYANDAGRVQIFLGGLIPDATADLTIYGASASANFGYATASAGDVNGDGYDDFLVGVPSETSGSAAGNRAHLYFGGTSLPQSPAIVMPGAAYLDGAGVAVAPAGDVNADGLADVLVSYIDAANAYVGKVALYCSSAPRVTPLLKAVADIPNDQGGTVRVRWARSGYDAVGITRITSYELQRSYPPQNGQFAWQTVAVVTPVKNPFYEFDAATPYDSMLNQSGTLYFRVLAKTSNPAEFWKSNILSGHSVDNLAPAAVMYFSVTSQGPANRLSWRMNAEPDLKRHVIYRSTQQTINVQSAVPLAYSADSVFVDSSPLGGEAYYFVAAQDIHNNTGIPASSPAPNAAVALTVHIEGIYTTEADTQIPDTITVFLRAGTAPHAYIDTARVALNTAGQGVAKFFRAATGSYYLAITHRNAVETWSKAGGELVTKGASVNYSFSSAQAQAFGNNLILKGSTWCLYSGDVNQDGLVDLNDLIAIDNDNTNFEYHLANDINLDSLVDLNDLIMVDNNNAAFISKQVPGAKKPLPGDKKPLTGTVER